MSKSAEAFRTISEAAKELDVPQHVLRHWEEVFGQVRPMRRAGGRRYYRPVDLDLLRGIRALLYDQRYTTKGVQKIFKDEGLKYVSELGRRVAAGEPVDMRPIMSEDGSIEGRADTEILDLTTADEAAEPLSPALRAKLTKLLARLEGVQEALDETTLALDAIRIAGGGDDVDLAGVAEQDDDSDQDPSQTSDGSADDDAETNPSSKG